MAFPHFPTLCAICWFAISSSRIARSSVYNGRIIQVQVPLFIKRCGYLKTTKQLRRKKLPWLLPVPGTCSSLFQFRFGMTACTATGSAAIHTNENQAILCQTSADTLNSIHSGQPRQCGITTPHKNELAFPLKWLTGPWH